MELKNTLFTILRNKVWHWNLLNWVLCKEIFHGKISRKGAPKKTRSRPLFISVKSYKYCQHIQETLLEIRYFERGLYKFLKKSDSIFLFEPNLLLWKLFHKAKGTWKYLTVSFQVAKMFKSFLSLGILYLAISDALIQRRFWVT